MTEIRPIEVGHEFAPVARQAFAASDDSNKATPLSLSSLVRKQRLGKGSFGEVYLAIHDQTGDRYALKVIDKSFIVKNASKRPRRGSTAPVGVVRPPGARTPLAAHPTS